MIYTQHLELWSTKLNLKDRSINAHPKICACRCLPDSELSHLIGDRLPEASDIAGELFRGVQCFPVAHLGVFTPALLMKCRVLGTDRRVVESG